MCFGGIAHGSAVQAKDRRDLQIRSHHRIKQVESCEVDERRRVGISDSRKRRGHLLSWTPTARFAALAVRLILVREPPFIMRLILPSVPASGALLVFLAGILGNALALQPTTTVGQDEDPNCRDTMDKCKFWSEIGECKSNPEFVQGACPLSCGICRPNAASTASDTSKCRLYLAESTTSEGGLGLFSAVPVSAGQTIPTISDLVIQLHDAEYNDMLRREKHFIAPNATDTSLLDILGSLVWDPPSQTAGEFDALDVKSLSAGIGMAAKRKTNLAVANVLIGLPEVDGGRLHRSHHAGAGAITAYHNRAAVALKDLPAGMELFAAYGDGIEEENAAASAELLDTIFDLSHKLGKSESELDEDLYKLIVEYLKQQSNRSLAALPDNVEDAKELYASGKMNPDDLVAQSSRPIEWLEQNGLCVDNIEEGLSKLPEAGRGAFATRALRKGQVIAPAPVAHIHRKNLELYFQDATETIDLMGHQLLQNYCYGHEKSSLMLFPFSPVVNLINHNGESPNAYIRWSSSHPFHSKDWFGKSVDAILNERQPGLMMEVVASRAIEPGEEIYIDYGSAWQESWQEHSKSWKVIGGDDVQYASATAINARDNGPVSTVNEIEDGSYPDNVETFCFAGVVDRNGVKDGDTIAWTEPSERNWQGKDRPLRCDVMSRKEDKYSVVVFIDDEEDGKEVKIENMPRNAITYVDAIYSKDQFLMGTFRHEIRVPDGMFPKGWLDLDKGEDYGDSCQLYVAESSIPNSGLGMYSLKEIKENDAVFFPEIVIQQQDHDWHNRERYYWFHKRGRKEPMHPKKEKSWLMHMYYWEPRNALGLYDGEDETQSIIPGLGMLANSHTGLVNALMTRPHVNSAGLHRSVDPGAGAFSAYHKYTHLATRHIPAGMELFVEYGDDWFEDRQKKLGVIPLSYDFEDTDNILKHFFAFVDGIPKEDDLRQSSWEMVHKYLVENKKMETVLPEDMEEARKKVLEKGTAMASVPDVIRSPDWLEKNGLCIDNIKEGRSTVKQAGRGAFTTRAIEKDAVIAPMPLVHFQRKHLHMYFYHEETDHNDYVGEQVLLNYCYSHPNSSLVFFPYSPVVNFINHDAKSPNAFIRWSSLPNHHSEWLDLSVEGLLAEYHAGLIMEVVALRPIAKGEEVFIDYGNGWQESWDEHVRNWKPVEGAGEYVSASELNEARAPFLTEEEQKEKPYPENVVLTCYVRGNIRKKQKTEPGPFGDSYEWRNLHKILHYHDNAYPCEILLRDEMYPGHAGNIRPEEVTYTARVYLDENEEDEGTIIHSIPPRAIEFNDNPDTKDVFMRNVFRHPIDIPDRIFPKNWRDLPDGVEKYDNTMPEKPPNNGDDEAVDGNDEL